VLLFNQRGSGRSLQQAAKSFPAERTYFSNERNDSGDFRLEWKSSGSVGNFPGGEVGRIGMLRLRWFLAAIHSPGG